MTIETYRILIFILAFILLFFLEKKLRYGESKYSGRGLNNILLVISSVLLIRLAFPSGLAILVENSPLLPWHLNQLPFALNLLCTIIVFDFAIYWQHRASHSWKWFWCFHKIHHTDKHLDFTSALRFHPGEILVSQFYKMNLILLIGPSFETYIIYEILLSSFALFNHADIKLPLKLEASLRKVIVTPQMHFPHHSPDKNRTNKNFGNILSCWDKLFKTYDLNENRVFGLNDFHQESFLFLIKKSFSSHDKID